MSKKLVYYNSSFANIPLDYSDIFGANYYDHWRAWDAGSLTLTGSLVDSASSLTGSGRSLASTGGSRPSLITDPIISKDAFEFDGVSEYMQVAASSALYKFLHDGTGGTVIVVTKQISTPAVVGIILNTGFGSTQVGSRLQTASSNIFASPASNGAANIYVNFASSVLNNNYQSLVSTFDVGNATAADRGDIVLDGVSNTNNVNTGTPTTANADDNFTVGVRNSDFSGFFYNGTIAEIIVIDALAMPTQLAQVQARLEFDYGIFPIT